MHACVAMTLTYKLNDYGGVDNCTLCDEYSQVNDYTRSDGRAVLLCPKCEKRNTNNG